MKDRPKFRALALFVCMCSLATACGLSVSVPLPPDQSDKPSFSFRHVWLFVMENHSYDSVIGSTDAPYLNGLAKQYGLATRMYAVSHPSLPNYLALISGSTFGCGSDECPPGYSGETLAGQLQAAHRSWGAYLEDVPGDGYVGGDVGGYVRHHNPFVFFSEVTGSPALLGSLHPLTLFQDSLRDPPAFSFVVPNEQHDMHYGSVAMGDAFAQTYVGAVVASPVFHDHGVVFIVWDEGSEHDSSGCCSPDIHGGHIPLIVVSGEGKRAFASTDAHSTYSLLRTIEEGLGLPPLLGAASATRLGEFWP